MLKRPFCHYFNTTGKCRFGKHCKFLHESYSETNIDSKPDSANHDEAVKSVPVVSSELGNFNFEDSKKNNGSLNQESNTPLSSSTSTTINQKPDTQRKNGKSNLNPELSGKSSAVRKEDRVICRSYARDKFCRFGNRCRYQHLIENKTQTDDLKHNELDKENKVQDEDVSKVDLEEKGPALASKDRKGKQSKRVCHFYKQGYCRKGSSCTFKHPGLNRPLKNEPPTTPSQEPESGSSNKDAEVVATGTASTSEKAPVVRGPQVSHCYKRDDVPEDKLIEMRTTEIKQLKRRFTSDRLKCIVESETEAKFVFTFSPTDPDWPFDVTDFDIAVEFQQDYPMTMFKLSLPEEQNLPETVRRYIEVSLEEWVKMKEEQSVTRGTVELFFRPFLRWLDRNLEELVTQALKQLSRELNAKAAGLEFVSGKELQKEYAHSSDEKEAESEQDGRRSEQAEPGVIIYKKGEKEFDEVYEVPQRGRTTSEQDGSDEEDTNSDEEADETEHKRPQINPDTERRGTELAFKNAQIWYCTTIMMEKLQLTVQCERCKHTTEFSTPPNRVNSLACGKCNTVQMVVFRPMLVHSYCSTFGFLDLDGCVAFDVNLQECHFSMGCIMCNRDVLIKHCTPGKLIEPFCRQCHNKMQFATEAVKMTRLTSDVEQSFFSGKVHTVKTKSLRRVAKDPAIQEGQPLPNNGACKHYKKSFRWLRFPCCGKTYPCDLCHDDNEDHEMKYANRMICGFCCREQPYASAKPCLGCNSALTRVRSQHWEGGKGCRDKISMSRNDDQKYSNLNKTVSRKSQAAKDKAKGKKNTKLRHS